MGKFRVLADEELAKALYMAPQASAIKVIESHIELRGQVDYMRDLVARLAEELGWANDSAVKNGALALTPETASLLAQAERIAKARGGTP